MSNSDWDQLLKKLNQTINPSQKVETHLLAVTLPESSWKQLSLTGESNYLTEADLVAWALGAYIERHKSTGELLTITFDKEQKLDPEVGVVVIGLANLLSNFSVEILSKISLDTLYYCRLICATLLERSEYVDSEYLKKLLDVCDSIITKRFDIIADVAGKSIATNFGVSHE